MMIELSKANPDIETLKLTLWVAAGIITILLGIVAWFARNKGERANRQMEKLEVIVNSLSVTVSNLKTVVEVIREQQNERDPRTERRLNEHGKRLDEHETRIVKVETRCKINHDEKVN
jgi:hypothetical protein